MFTIIKNPAIIQYLIIVGNVFTIARSKEELNKIAGMLTKDKHYAFADIEIRELFVFSLN